MSDLHSIDSMHYKKYIWYALASIATRGNQVSVVSQRASAGPPNIRGVDQHLGRWLKAQAAFEGKTIGQKLNEILAGYKHKAESP